jgi:hypothetical protein
MLVARIGENQLQKLPGFRIAVPSVAEQKEAGLFVVKLSDFGRSIRLLAAGSPCLHDD